MIDPCFQWDWCSGAKSGHSVVACDRRVVDWRSACRWEAGSDSSSQEGVAPPDWESSWVAAIGIGEGSALTSESVEGIAPPDWESRLVAAMGIGEGSALTSTSESVEGICGSVLQAAAAGESEVAGGFL